MRTFKLVAINAIVTLAVTLLEGCNSTPESQPANTSGIVQSPVPTPLSQPSTAPTPEAQPSPFDYSAIPGAGKVRMDKVKRRAAGDALGIYRIILNGEPLNLKTKSGVELQIDALRWTYVSASSKPKQNKENGKLVYYPVRSIGEKLGKRIDWEAKQRRVFWNGLLVPQPITLADGLSYINEPTLRRFTKLSIEHYESPGTTSSYAEISSQRSGPKN